MSRNSSASIDSNQQYYFGHPSHSAASKTIIPGIVFVEQEYYHDKLGKYLEKFEWSNWMHAVYGELFYPDLIVDFYKSAVDCTEQDDDPHIEFTVLGKTFSLNCEKIAQIFNIPNRGQKVFFIKKLKGAVRFENGQYWHTILRGGHGDTKIKVKDLKPEFLLLSKFIMHNILPRGGHVDDVTKFAAFIMHRIATNEPLNLPYIIMNYMWLIIVDNLKEGKDNSRTLGYGLYLTKIFRHFQIDLESITSGVPRPLVGWEEVKYTYKHSPFRLTINSCMDEQVDEDVATTLVQRSFHHSQYQDEGTSNNPNASQPTADLPDLGFSQMFQNDYQDPRLFDDNFYFGNSGF